mmetsp:Transcript_33238/g.107480  ORF Transcript_33238/g.107480 Transcript_33238/m.107480 type:complete len:223 (+) Transcript_33238:66-734(+)
MAIIDLGAVRAAAIILASASPRRVDILNNVLGLQARVVPSTFEENLDKTAMPAHEYVQRTAHGKALEVYERLVRAGEAPPRLVIGADTVVVADGCVLEKPADAAGAAAMLSSLSGRSHQVCTGVSFIYGPQIAPPTGTAAGVPEPLPHEHSFVEVTTVDFCDLSSEAIERYIASGEPMDKAGSYGIQGLGGTFVTGIRGCYHNVVGFPMHRFCKEIDLERLR